MLSIPTEEDLLGDEEIMQYIKWQQTKKTANSMSQKQMDNLLAFPDSPLPGQPLAPAGPWLPN